MQCPVEARIDVAISESDDEIMEAIEKNRDIVEGETLSNVSTQSFDLSQLRKEHDIDGKPVTVEIKLSDIAAAMKAKPEDSGESE